MREREREVLHLSSHTRLIEITKILLQALNRRQTVIWSKPLVLSKISTLDHQTLLWHALFQPR